MGDVPEGLLVDHINGNELHNTRCSLRSGTSSQNNANRVKPTYGILWTCAEDERYPARVMVRRKFAIIQTYDTAEEAAMISNEVTQLSRAAIAD